MSSLTDRFPERFYHPDAPTAFVKPEYDPQMSMTGYSWIILECPYCGKTHRHGAGRLNLDPTEDLSMRFRHCTTEALEKSGNARSERTDYNLALHPRYKNNRLLTGCDVVYFIRAGKGAIKIGYSGNLEGRLKQLQAFHSEKLKILKAIPGTQVEEFELHKRFKHLQVRGEWFNPAPELLSYIKGLPKI